MKYNKIDAAMCESTIDSSIALTADWHEGYANRPEFKYSFEDCQQPSCRLLQICKPRMARSLIRSTRDSQQMAPCISFSVTSNVEMIPPLLVLSIATS